ncbi:MAG: carbohydrate kinase [Acidihalobacter sp.]
MKRSPVIFGEVLFDCFGDDCVLGGAPFNVAWHLQGFGLAPRFVSRVGADELGEEVRARMRDWGMDTRWLQTDASHPTGRVQVALQDGQPSYDILDQQAYDAIEPPQDLLCDDSVLYHGSLALRHPANAAVLQNLSSGARVFLDVNLRAPWWDAQTLAPLIANARWLKLNDEEFDLLARADETPAEYAARMGLGAVVLTRGARGAEVYAGDQHFETPTPTVPELIDTVGAGDAFSAVTLYGIDQGWPWELILRRAAAFAARVCGWRGALSHDRAIYEETAREWRRANGD